jgi:hypothetical protein
MKMITAMPSTVEKSNAAGWARASRVVQKVFAEMAPSTPI